ncbi:MAG: CoB--CoM heterodisulfide reductase iron-sulfur subunit B family protein [Planctomycetota bacterium]|jgi:heterodisulfide reductase subunit B
MRVAYYPGCSLHSSGVEYDISMRKVCAALGIELAEIKDWICCGSTPAHQCDELMSLALPAKNLALTKQMGGLRQVCAPCASCYSRLRFAQEKLNDENIKKDVENVIGSKFPDGIEVLHALDVIVDLVGIEAVREKAVRSLEGLKVACYYGCLITRPPNVTGRERFENPEDMESVMEALGAEPVDWNMKTYCCGASFALTNTDVVLELTREILEDAEAAGAETIAVGCPLCHVNLDGRQRQINEKFGTNFHIPIFYFTELIGLALGIRPEELGVFRHLTEVEEFLEARTLI